MRTVRWITCWVAMVGLMAGLALGTAPATPAAPAEPDVKTMTVAQLLAEYRDYREMKTPEGQRRVDVVNALRRAGPPLIEVLRGELADPDANVERRALYVLLRLGNKARPLATEIVKAGESTDAGVRGTAISVLSHLRDPRAFDLIVRAVHDPAAGVRLTAVRDGTRALADAPFAVAVLALGDTDGSVRNQAIQQLLFARDKRAVAYLAPVLEDEKVLNYEIREGVKTARRNCDDAAGAMEYLVNGKYPLPDAKTQEEKDAQVKQWREWWKQKGAGFDVALYDEPELKKSLE